MSEMSPPIALIVGLCSHGLAMARALAKEGIEVHALEANANLPGAVTSCAKVHFIKSIKSISLVEDLIQFRERFERSRQIVLFPTNDNNVKIIGQHIDKITPLYVLSWSQCVDKVLSLLLKSNIETRCQEVGLNYPQSFVVKERSDINEVAKRFEFPVIAKPVNPQSGFKAIKCDNVASLARLLNTYHRDLPILVQHWITGTDKDLFFGAMYLVDGDIKTEFIGQKLESFPPAMGQTTIATNAQNDDVIAITRTFFDGLAMSGPVSLELKKDHKGRYWVIEPTIGRTDFWAGLCVEAGCNLLFAEYLHAIGRSIPDFSQRKDVIWFDSERDITAYPRYCKMSLPLLGQGYSTSFSYLAKNDLKPFTVALVQAMKRIGRSIFNRLRRESEPSIADEYQCIIVNSLSELPEDFKTLLNNTNSHTLFNDSQWYDNFCRSVASKSGEIKFYCMSNLLNQAVAILPMWQQNRKFKYALSADWLTSLTNYYSPCFQINVNEKLISNQCAITYLVKRLAEESDNWHALDFFPLTNETLANITHGAKASSLSYFPYWMTKNYYQLVDDSFEQYYAGLSSRVKNTIERKRKRLTKECTWNIEIINNSENIEQHIHDYHHVYDHSWKRHEPYPEFISNLIRQSTNKGNLRLGILTIENKPVATQLWLVDSKQAYIYKLAYNEQFKSYSPGSLLTLAMFEQVIDVDKVRKIDFLTGNDNFKRDWMTESQDLYGVQIINPKSIVGGYLLARNKISELRKRFFA